MTLVSNDGEAGTVGSVVSTADASPNAFTNVVSSSITYGSTAMHGNNGFHVNVAASVAAYLEWQGIAGSVNSGCAFRMYIRLTSLPVTNSEPIAYFRSGGGGTGLFALQIDLTGALFITSDPAGGTTQVTSAGTMSTGTWYRIELQATDPSSTTGTVNVQTYLGDSTSAVSNLGFSVSGLNIGSGSTLGTVRIGRPTAISSPFAFDFDDVAFQTATTTPIGPAAQPTGSIALSGSGSLTLSTIRATSGGGLQLSGSGAFLSSSPGSSNFSAAMPISGSGSLSFGGGSPTIAPTVAGTPTVYESASATSAIVPVPTGVSAKETLFSIITHSAQVAPTTATPGWILLTSQNGFDSSSPSTTVWYRKVDGTETSSYTFATSTTANRVTGIMFRAANVDGSFPFDGVTPVKTAAGASTSFTMPAISTQTANDTLFTSLALNTANSADFVTAGTWTKVAGTAGTGRRAAVYSEVQQFSGASATDVWTDSGVSLQWTGVKWAVKGIPSQYGSGTLSVSGSGTLQPGAGSGQLLLSGDGSAFIGGSITPAPTLKHRMVGIPGPTSAVVSARLTNATSARLIVGTDFGVSQNLVYSPPVTVDSLGNASNMQVTGLTAGTTYWYRVAMTGLDGVERQDTSSTVGRFKTAPVGATNFAFSFGSSTNAADSDAMGQIANHGDDLFFHLGDMFYADTTGTSLSNFRNQMNAKLEAPNHSAVFATTPTAYTPGSHDGMNALSTFGSDSTAWTNFNQVYRELIPAPSIPSSTGVYYTFVWGRIRFIQLDDRSFKSSPLDPEGVNKTALGSVQKQWLKDTITNSTEPAIVIIQSDAWDGSAVSTDDSWAGYATERSELAGFFSNSGKSITLLAGDMHALAADNGLNTPGGVYLFHAGPFVNNATQEYLPYAAGPYPASGTGVVQQYGRVVITDNGQEIDIAFSGYSSDGTQRVALTRTIQVNGLQIAGSGGLSLSGSPVFPGDLETAGAGSLTWNVVGSSGDLETAGTGSLVMAGAVLKLNVSGQGWPSFTGRTTPTRVTRWNGTQWVPSPATMWDGTFWRYPTVTVFTGQPQTTGPNVLTSPTLLTRG